MYVTLKHWFSFPSKCINKFWTTVAAEGMRIRFVSANQKWLLINKCWSLRNAFPAVFRQRGSRKSAVIMCANPDAFVGTRVICACLLIIIQVLMVLQWENDLLKPTSFAEDRAKCITITSGRWHALDSPCNVLLNANVKFSIPCSLFMLHLSASCFHFPFMIHHVARFQNGTLSA